MRDANRIYNTVSKSPTVENSVCCVKRKSTDAILFSHPLCQTERGSQTPSGMTEVFLPNSTLVEIPDFGLDRKPSASYGKQSTSLSFAKRTQEENKVSGRVCVRNERACFAFPVIGGVVAATTSATPVASVAAILGGIAAGFVLGVMCAAATWYVQSKRRRVRVPSSPCYMSSKQNPYVTVPLKPLKEGHGTERNKAKRSASFSSATSNGSLHKPPLNGHAVLPHTTPKLFSDYDSGTFKRHSNTLNGSIRADGQDKFY